MTEDRHQAPLPSPEDALTRLKMGNLRFVLGEARFPTVPREVLADLAKGQQPFATILACSDSRVPPELVFDAGFGELFVVRVAGNVLGSAVAGTLQYAKVHLRTPLFVVMGHQGCGAVKAALAAKFEGALHCERIELLLEGILPSLDDVDATLPAAALLDAAVEANVRRTVRQLRASPEGRAELASGAMKLVGAVYDLDTGRVRFLE
ncbi:MAG: carbonic anhydrase [Betaproteobacteria bacterium]|nr:carbonic anhydrase [Betaproteobacteria bacterium]